MDQNHLDERIQAYYGTHWDEGARLTTRSLGGVLELRRVQELLRARLAPGSRIIDIGGGTGIHAGWLAADGHRVRLVDPVAEQVALAGQLPGVDAAVGDVRGLAEPDDDYDVALLFGPLYHLVGAQDRVSALTEAARVVRPGGLVAVQVISRITAATDVTLDAPTDESFPGRALAHLLRTGENSPEIESPVGGFPGGHFHNAAELRCELEAAGLTELEIVAVEGPGAMALELIRVGGPDDEELLAAATTIARRTESSRYAADLSPHLMGLGTVPS